MQSVNEHPSAFPTNPPVLSPPDILPQTLQFLNVQFFAIHESAPILNVEVAMETVPMQSINVHLVASSTSGTYWGLHFMNLQLSARPKLNPSNVTRSKVAPLGLKSPHDFKGSVMVIVYPFPFTTPENDPTQQLIDERVRFAPIENVAVFALGPVAILIQSSSLVMEPEPVSLPGSSSPRSTGVSSFSSPGSLSSTPHLLPRQPSALFMGWRFASSAYDVLRLFSAIITSCG